MPPHGATPETLFLGTTTGRGTLRLGLGRPRPFRVHSIGRPQADGTFRLDQVVTFDGAPPRSRHWILRPGRGGRHAFELSDASGPGTATAEATRLVLRYPLGRGLHMRQVLVPSRDGRTIANTGRLRWLGMPVGRLQETISRTP